MERCRGARGASTGDSVVGLARLAIALPVFEGLHVLGLLHGLLPTWIIPVPPLGTPVLLELLVVVAKLVVPRLGHLLVVGLHRGGKGAASKTGVHRKGARRQQRVRRRASLRRRDGGYVRATRPLLEF